MSDADSLYGGSPSPSLEGSTLIDEPTGVDNGNDEANDDGSSSALAESPKGTISPEPEIIDTLAVRPSQIGRGEEEAVDNDPTSDAPRSPPRTPGANLPCDFVVLDEACDGSDRPGPSTKDKGKWKEGEEAPPGPSKTGKGKAKQDEEEEVVDDPPSTVHREGYAMVAPNLGVELFVVKTDNERAEAARRAKFEADSQDIYPVRVPALPTPSPTPSAPAFAFASVSAAPAVQIPEEDVELDEESDYDAGQPTTGIERPVQK